MPNYVCPRCHYSTNIKTHMRNHFNRRNPCRIVHCAKTIDECFQEVLGIIRSNSLNFPQFPSKNPSNISYIPSKTLKNPQKPSISLNFPQNISYKTIDNNNNNIPNNNKTISLYGCIYCNKQYSRKDNLNRHIKKCKMKNNIILNNSNNNSDNKDIYTKDEVEEIIEKTKLEYHFRETQSQTIIQELRKQVEQLLKNQGSNNITYNTNIVLNAFGKENTSYISNEYIKDLIAEFISFDTKKNAKSTSFNNDIICSALANA